MVCYHSALDSAKVVEALNDLMLGLAQEQHLSRCRLILQNHASLFPPRKFPMRMFMLRELWSYRDGKLNTYGRLNSLFMHISSLVTLAVFVEIAVNCIMACTDMTQLAVCKIY